MSDTSEKPHPILSRSDCCKILQHWVVEGKVPRLISKSDGQILWCNPEFEDLVGYSLAEFHRGTMDWRRLTTNQLELETDEEMVRQVLSGERRDYTLIKNYQSKTKGLIRVQLCAQRWPPAEDTTDEVLFLCEVLPLNGHHPASCETTHHVMARLARDVQDMRNEIMRLSTPSTEMSDVIEWVVKQIQAHPKTWLSIGSVILVLLLGEAGFALVMKIVKAVAASNGVPVVVE